MNSLYRAIYSDRDAQVFAIPPLDEAAMRVMALSSTVTSHSLDTTSVANVAGAVAQVFAGVDPVELFTVYFAQKLCHRRRGLRELDRKGRRAGLGGRLWTTSRLTPTQVVMQHGLRLPLTADSNAVSPHLSERERIDSTTELVHKREIISM